MDTLLLPVAVVNRQKCKISQFFGHLGTNGGTIQGIGAVTNGGSTKLSDRQRVPTVPAVEFGFPGRSILSFGWSYAGTKFDSNQVASYQLARQTSCTIRLEFSCNDVTR